MASLAFDTREWLRPPQEFAEYLERILLAPEESAAVPHERRAEPRYRVVLSVIAVAVDDNLQPLGKPFPAVTRDISNRGVSLYSSQPATTKYLAIKLPIGDSRDLKAAVEVLRCQPVGPMFQIGGKFVTKVYEPKEASATEATVSR